MVLGEDDVATLDQLPARNLGYHPLEVGEMMVESRTGQKDDIRRKYIAERKLGWGVYSTVGRLRCPRPCGVVLRDNLFQVWLAKEVVKKSSKTAAPRLAIKIQKSAKEYRFASTLPAAPQCNPSPVHSNI